MTVPAIAHKGLRWLLTIPMLLIALTLVSCSDTGQPVTPQQVAASVPTSIPVSDPTSEPAATSTWPVPPDDATHFARATAEEQYIEQMETVVALTPPPTPPTPEPEQATPTIEYGGVECSNGDNRYPDLLSCWRGILNGQVISVGTGGPGSSMDTDPMQGLLLVFNGLALDASDPTAEVYDTPLKLGPVRIIAEDGTRISVAPIDMRTPFALLTPWMTATPGTTFVFDLAARQWVNTPISGPSPSVSASPIASVSPLPTQLP